MSNIAQPTSFYFHCGVCSKRLSDHNTLFTSCGHFFCLPSPTSHTNCTNLQPSINGKPATCEQCHQPCEAAMINNRAQNHNQKVQDFLYADIPSKLRGLADLVEFRAKHDKIVSHNLSSLRHAQQRANQLQSENERLRVSLAQLQKQFNQLKSENHQYASQLHQLRPLQQASHTSTLAQSLTLHNFQPNNKHDPSPLTLSQATEKLHGIQSTETDRYQRRKGRYEDANQAPGPLHRSHQPSLQDRQTQVVPYQQVQRQQHTNVTTQKISTEKTRETGGRLRPTRESVDPLRFQSARMKTGKYTYQRYGGEIRTNRFASRKSSFPSTGRFSSLSRQKPASWQDRVSLLPRPSATPDLMRRSLQRELDGNPVNPIAQKRSRR